MTQTPLAGEGASTPRNNSDENNSDENNSDENKSDKHNREDHSTDRAGRGSASDRPSHGGQLRRLGAAVPLRGP